MFGLFGTVWALMQFVCAPVLGALSDRWGRRPVILISCTGLGLDYVLMALAPTLWWLFVGRVISGITAASFSTAGAYIADVTPLEKRAAGFGMIGAAFGLGFVLGPAMGGVLGAVDPRLPFWVAAALALANAAYGYFVLPESLPPERRKAFSWSHMAGWYSDAGCDTFLQRVWDDRAIAAQLEGRLRQTEAWSIIEELVGALAVPSPP